jgi:hypothetical protein
LKGASENPFRVATDDQSIFKRSRSHGGFAFVRAVVDDFLFSVMLLMLHQAMMLGGSGGSLGLGNHHGREGQPENCQSDENLFHKSIQYMPELLSQTNPGTICYMVEE